MKNNLPLNASAVLIWLPKDERPDGGDWDVTRAKNPPLPNPEPWWTLKDAVVYAVTVERKHDKLPWIKTVDQLLSPQEILQVYRSIRPQGSVERLSV